MLSPPETHAPPGSQWSKVELPRTLHAEQGAAHETRDQRIRQIYGFIPSPPPSPRDLETAAAAGAGGAERAAVQIGGSATFVARVFDLYKQDPRAMLRNERRWLALGERGRKRARVVRRARARAAVRGALPAPLPAVPKLKQSSREHYAHTQSFDVANTPYEELPDFCPPTSTLDKINHPRPLRAEWKGIPLDLSNDPHVGELHPAEVYLASQLRLPAMVYLDNKRRIFAEYHARKEAGLGFRRTDAQRCARIDVNKASRLWQAFERVGWLD
ncbi:uncharacterized protein T551_02202 [Pneumocystis jirovecii RU7]|uniref:SWIRM domain-containing protein n=1 Tax=Pneumocystis jirovecii (strain RU7) TaxID=1408657 RepID=A0A0W4ZMI6_PNEJ7|nr:uncharacterized protein T551_02202 [Pneumocystis jirovecii RU7]KTW29586.1 hypothetical protein T551_02202 [Pneumocystis jirovecii RU7]